MHVISKWQILGFSGNKIFDSLNKKFLRCFLVWLAYHRGVCDGGCWCMLVWLYTWSCPLKSYFSPYLLLHKKMRFWIPTALCIDILKTIQDFFSDISCFYLALAYSSNKRNSGFSRSAQNYENFCVMFQEIMVHSKDIFIKFKWHEGSFKISFCYVHIY